MPMFNCGASVYFLNCLKNIQFNERIKTRYAPPDYRIENTQELILVHRTVA